jgi:hypothetical protein
MTEPIDQFAELTRRGHEVFTAAVRAWEHAARSIAEAARRPEGGPPDIQASVDAAFDFAAKMLDDQRDFTKTLMSVGSQVVATTARRAVRGAEPPTEPEPTAEPATKPATEPEATAEPATKPATRPATGPEATTEPDVRSAPAAEPPAVEPPSGDASDRRPGPAETVAAPSTEPLPAPGRDYSGPTGTPETEQPLPVVRKTAAKKTPAAKKTAPAKKTTPAKKAAEPATATAAKKTAKKTAPPAKRSSPAEGAAGPPDGDTA